MAEALQRIPGVVINREFGEGERVNLRGTFTCTRAAGNYWREQSKAGNEVAAAKKAGKRLHPVHNRIYDPATDALKEFVQSGAIGEVFLAQTLGLEPPRTVSVRPWLVAGGGIKLNRAAAPGDYTLQLVVTDLLAKEGRRTATQWLDFKIVR